MRKQQILRIILSFGCLGLVTTANAGDLSQSDQALRQRFEAIVEYEKEQLLDDIQKSQDALVIVEFVLKVQVSRGGQQQPARERKHRVNGTTVRPDGLTICSASAADPSESLSAASRGRVKVNLSVLSAKIILNDGTEIEAKTVFKDPDLDLLFVKPKEADRDFAHVTLDATRVPGMLDTTVSLNRLDLSTNRAVVVTVGAVRGIIEGPPKYFVILPMPPGLPVFDEEGRCFGMYLRRKNASGIPAGNALALPAEDILDTMDQIPPERKPEPKPDTEPKEPPEKVAPAPAEPA